MTMRSSKEPSATDLPSRRRDRTPPPFVEEVETVDRTRSRAENSELQRDEVEASDEKARVLDRVHRLAR
jgi:hypothetical protein